MTLEIALLLGVLAVMVALFLTEKLPIDLTAFAGLVVLVATGYLEPDEAFAGFASPAVITMLAIFIVSAALLQTGVADFVGSRVHALVGSREVPLAALTMVVAGLLSAFMNNIAATAVLMPAIAMIARRAELSPSRLFMPLSFGAILGGTTTMVGTPPNILTASILRARGLEPFSLFDFTSVGLILLGVGTVYMATAGRRLLPKGEPAGARSEARDLARLYRLEENVVRLRVLPGSPLEGASLRDLELGATLGAQVVEIDRAERHMLVPAPETVLRSGDVLTVQGRREDVEEILAVRGLEIVAAAPGDLTPPGDVVGFHARVREGSELVGRTLGELRFREQRGLVVLGVVRGSEVLHDRLATIPLAAGDLIVGQGARESFDRLGESRDFIEVESVADVWGALGARLFVVAVSPESALAGRTLRASRLGELMGLTVGGIMRDGVLDLGPRPEEVVRAGDRLLVSGDAARLEHLSKLGGVEIESSSEAQLLESEEVGVIETTLSPRSSLAGRSLRDVRFRERFGLLVLSLWREGHPLHERLADLDLRVGDALLVQGPWSKIRDLARDRDFVVLSPLALQAPRRVRKAPVALAGLGLMIGLVVTGWQPIHVAAFAAATFVLLGGALTMEEAYRAIEWRAIFLVAAVLPVGVAMERSGAALLLANRVADLAGPLGPYGVLAAVVVLSSLLSQGLDGAPAVVLVAPVALDAAERLGLSPYPVMMGVGLAASAAFMTPFSHKANLLVMGLGGYRSSHFVRVGTPLTVLVLAIIVILVPVFFPFAPG